MAFKTSFYSLILHYCFKGNAFRAPPLVISVGAAEVDALEPAGELDDTDTFCNDEEALTGTIMSIFNVTRYVLESWSRQFGCRST